MPWKVTRIMDERMRFIELYDTNEYSVAQLCRLFDISRPTAYKWIARYDEAGIDALADRSRARKTQTRATGAQQEELILDARGAHPRWGPRKLKAWLEHKRPGLVLPAPSTIGALLKRHGLVMPRKRLRRATASPGPLTAAGGPNRLWCVDFKGWFRTGDGVRCDPLTVTDAHSRYLLCCQAVAKTNTDHVHAVFETLFRHWGLPEAIRSDNGSPFASTGLGGLSRLSVWWIRLGIVPERIRPGKPQENGSHERMHLTLLQETASPPEANGRAQQRAFESFREEFNLERPHEALGLKAPACFYEPSPRPYPERLEELVYPDDWPTRSVRGSGQIKWDGLDVRVTRALIGERVGFEPIDDGLWRVWFGGMAVGWFDERRMSVMRKRRAGAMK